MARTTDHIPDPHRHRTLFYGHYANRARGARGKEKALLDAGQAAGPKKRRCSPSWARLISKVYHADPHLPRMWGSAQDHRYLPVSCLRAPETPRGAGESLRSSPSRRADPARNRGAAGSATTAGVARKSRLVPPPRGREEGDRRGRPCQHGSHRLARRSTQRGVRKAPAPSAQSVESASADLEWPPELTRLTVVLWQEGAPASTRPRLGVGGRRPVCQCAYDPDPAASTDVRAKTPCSDRSCGCLGTGGSRDCPLGAGHGDLTLRSLVFRRPLAGRGLGASRPVRSTWVDQLGPMVRRLHRETAEPQALQPD